jgi:hypothetical protein
MQMLNGFNEGWIEFESGEADLASRFQMFILTIMRTTSRCAITPISEVPWSTTPSVRPVSFGFHLVRQHITSALVVKARGIFKDTVLIKGFSRVDVDFVADNPGLTLFLPTRISTWISASCDSLNTFKPFFVLDSCPYLARFQTSRAVPDPSGGCGRLRLDGSLLRRC